MLNKLHISDVSPIPSSEVEALMIAVDWVKDWEEVSDDPIDILYNWYTKKGLKSYLGSKDVVYRGLNFSDRDMEDYIPKLLAGKSIDLPNTRRYNSWTGDLSTAFFFGSPGIVLSSKLGNSKYIDLMSVKDYFVSVKGRLEDKSRGAVEGLKSAVNSECEIITSSLVCDKCDLGDIESIVVYDKSYDFFMDTAAELGYNISGSFSKNRNSTSCIVNGKNITLYEDYNKSNFINNLKLKPTIKCFG